MKWLLLSFLGRVFVDERQKAGVASAVRRTCAAAIAVRYVHLHRQLFELPIFRQYIGRIGDRDPLFHLSHRHYLSKRFSYRERIECVLAHYRFENGNYDHAYREAVYGDGGLAVWSARIEDVDYAIRLRLTTQPPQEGGTGIVLYANDEALCEISYVWVDGAMLGLPGGPVPFATKNQSVRFDDERLRRFRRHFPQNSPAYFCFAALHGVAAAHGCMQIAGIRDDCQISYSETHASSFRNAYNEFWRAFEGVEVGGHVYVMPVPMATRPLEDIKSKHRKRAMARRNHWKDVFDAALQAMQRHRCASTGTERLRVVTFFAAQIMTGATAALPI